MVFTWYVIALVEIWSVDIAIGAAFFKTFGFLGFDLLLLCL